MTGLAWPSRCDTTCTATPAVSRIVACVCLRSCSRIAGGAAAASCFGATYSGAQDGWFHCSQCQGIFFGNTNTRAGVCPLDNSAYVHNGSGSFAYIMIS
jgi:hypothetical protein